MNVENLKTHLLFFSPLLALDPKYWYENEIRTRLQSNNWTIN